MNTNEGISATWTDSSNEFAGNWIDTRTGNSVIVRNNIEDADGNIILITNKGNISLSEFGNFVKMSEEDYGQQGLSPEVTPDQLNNMINQGLSKDERIEQVNIINTNNITLDTPIGTSTETNNVQQTSNTTSQTKPVENNEITNINLSLIKKVMDKYENAITIEFSINPNEWPKQELQMLINTFDVTPEELCDYIIENYLDKTALINPLKEYIMSVLVVDLNK